MPRFISREGFRDLLGDADGFQLPVMLRAAILQAEESQGRMACPVVGVLTGTCLVPSLSPRT